MSEELVEIAVEIKTAKFAAFLVSDGVVWTHVPYSLIRNDDMPELFQNARTYEGRSMVLTVPYWFAHKEGLI